MQKQTNKHKNPGHSYIKISVYFDVHNLNWNVILKKKIFKMYCVLEHRNTKQYIREVLEKMGLFM